jgi:hypothetical protein
VKTGCGSYPMIGFGIGSADASDSATTVLLNHGLSIFSITVNWYK